LLVKEVDFLSFCVDGCRV